MSNIKAEVSKKNKYWISRHKFYELKHFCLQYKEYRELYLDLSIPGKVEAYARERNKYETSDPTVDLVIRRDKYKQNMHLIEQTAVLTDPDLTNYIFRAVTEGKSYTWFEMQEQGIPCSRDTFYDRYRRFFWLLSKKR